VIKEAENVEEFGRDADGCVVGAVPARELAGGGPCAEDAVLPVDLAENCCLGLRGLRLGGGAELQLK
jgi:hypothetical protein